MMLFRKAFTLSLITVAGILQSQVSHATLQCPKVYHPSSEQKTLAFAPVKSIRPDLPKYTEQIRQLMIWEQTSNQDRWEKPQHAIEIDYVSTPKSEVSLRKGKGVSQKLLSIFDQGQELNWYRHPLNQSDTVPFRKKPRSGFLQGYYSASRSIFMNIKGELYSFKLGTDHPHPKADAQPGKADLLNDSDISMRRSQHIRQFDETFGRDGGFYILTEVLSLSARGNGMSVRDLRPLQDGNFYLPAFSIPYQGRKIAEKMGVQFEHLWQTNYAVSLGKAKALLALRYGLQMKTPNAQNWLIQLNPQQEPTGVIYMRDVADSNYIDFIAKHIAPEQMNADKNSRYTVMTDLKPFWENSAWQMDEGNVSRETLNAWGVEHDRAYIETFQKVLGIEQDFQNVSELQKYLQSPQGQELLRQYGESLREGQLDDSQSAA